LRLKNSFLFIVLFFFTTSLYGSKLEYRSWPKGESFLLFLKHKNISKDIYYNLDDSDKQLCAEIVAGVRYEVLVENNITKQYLIPINHKIQIHLRKEDIGYSIDFIPIVVKEHQKSVSLKLKTTLFSDIYTKTKNKALAAQFISLFRGINFKKMKLDDKISINFNTYTRDGKTFAWPRIISASIEVGKKRYYQYLNPKDERYYDKKGVSKSNFFLKVPLKYKRISSGFTYRRWHPILKKYRAHHGIDYAAPRGRRIYASGTGKIIFKGRKGGYGKTVIIQHKHGFKTLYAHMDRYSRAKRGQHIKQGTLVGYVGSTGVSTGPHLHFGLYKGSRAINPANRVKRVIKTKLRGKQLVAFQKIVKTQDDILQKVIEENKKYDISKDIKNSCERL